MRRKKTSCGRARLLQILPTRLSWSTLMLVRPEARKRQSPLSRLLRKREARIPDVCVIVEGAYPYVSGGVSAWVHGLIRRQPDLRFCVVAILPEPPAPVAKYGALPNLDALHHLYLTESYGNDGWRRPRSF